MLDFYKLNSIPILLKNFKVKKAIISGLLDENLANEIFKYDAQFIAITSNFTHPQIKTINGNPLDVLNHQKNYEAIFINDDPNWYTVYNELNIIKKTNDEFPIVFICNNTFPHKRRDTYKNPKNIPQNYKQESIKGLPIIYDGAEIIIEDNYFHACDENTPKNGVSTAIEDFLDENSDIDLVEFKFIEDITILCPKTTISKIRIDKTKHECFDKKLNIENFSDILIENQLLLSYLEKYNIKELNSSVNTNKKIIKDYENKIHVQDSEIKLKESQLIGVTSELNVKDLQIKDFESKLTNKNNDLNSLESKLQSANTEIKYLKNEINNIKSLSKNNEADYIFKIKASNEKINSLEKDLSEIESKMSKDNNDLKVANRNLSKELKVANQDLSNQIKKVNNLYSEIKSTKKLLNAVKQENLHQITELNSKDYCLLCFKEEISNNELEINYFKNQSLIKKFISPSSYLYLLLKSKPNEFLVNFKLYNSLKNSKCFDIGYYLNNNSDIERSRWIKYFSPELHYVCKGFEEKRKFNKKYFNTNSKEELLEYISTCEHEK
ncbi:hypothetical protein [Methanobrevibacter millerae]|uniref:Uncharacterized protein n=1 Tax=Methanobrevibacter millerae TaxID=230361 RepID=A0A1G5V8X8_9EURY|nr:hypothetical protein [Methanobrevibacter millerae]SDA42312.1 hypothetical protein SAMN02910315_00435 [Methanobrevibacter millerae]